MALSLPTISVVTPSYNQGRYIEATIRSVLDQTYAPMEYIVKDGGSTDETVEILKKYGDRIRWVSERDDGQPGAVDRGIREAAGEIIGWVNSDDRYADESVLRRIVEEFARDPGLDFLYGDGFLADAEGKPFRASPAREVKGVKDVLVHPTSFALQPAVFFRRQLYLDVGGVDPSLHYAFDYDLWIRMFQRSPRVKYLKVVLAHATAHGEAKSVAGMGKLIRETVAVKRRRARAVQMTIAERWKMHLGIAELYVYLMAVRLGLRRAS